MKNLKSYKIFESFFDPSSIEDILLDLKDEGHNWTIDIRKTSKGDNYLFLYIEINAFFNTKYSNKNYLEVENLLIEDLQCLIRCTEYLKSEGFLPTGYTEDKIDCIKNKKLEPDEWISGWPGEKEEVFEDSLPTLELTYELK
jgi:hypothetical protein